MVKEIEGSILDIGGGGEGIVYRVYLGQVVSIDNLLEELEESPDGPRKIVMDARQIAIPNEYFDNATAFFSFMYMPKLDHPSVIAEIKRILKNHGNFYLWEPDIETANPFIAELEINANGCQLNTTYGVYKEDTFQNASYYKALLNNRGFKLTLEENTTGRFYQCWGKV